MVVNGDSALISLQNTGDLQELRFWGGGATRFKNRSKSLRNQKPQSFGSSWQKPEYSRALDAGTWTCKRAGGHVLVTVAPASDSIFKNTESQDALLPVRDFRATFPKNNSEALKTGSSAMHTGLLFLETHSWLEECRPIVPNTEEIPLTWNMKTKTEVGAGGMYVCVCVGGRQRTFNAVTQRKQKCN